MLEQQHVLCLAPTLCQHVYKAGFGGQHRLGSTAWSFDIMRTVSYYTYCSVIAVP